MKNREEEMREYYKEALNMPAEMEMDVLRQRVLKRAAQYTLRRNLKIGVAAAAALVLAFVTGVNTSETFADAVMTVPVLGDLAKAVQWNKSISSAVENGFAVSVGQSVQVDGMNIICTDMLTDSENLVLFFKAENVTREARKHYFSMEIEQIIDTDTGEELNIENGVFGEVATDGSIWVISLKVPRQAARNVEVCFKLHDNTRENTQELAFRLSLPEPSAPVEYDLKEEIVVENQHFTIEHVSLYPTCAYVDVELDPANTKELLNMELSMVNGDGESWGNVKHGLYRIDVDENHYRYCIESSYFENSEGLRLVVDRVDLLSSDRKQIFFDTKTGRFYDAYGDLTELKKEQMDYGDDSIYCSLNAVTSNNNTVPFDYYLGSDGEWHSCGLGITGTDEKIIYMISRYEADENGIVTFRRAYPDVVAKVDQSIALK